MEFVSIQIGIIYFYFMDVSLHGCSMLRCMVRLEMHIYEYQTLVKSYIQAVMKPGVFR